MVGFCQILILIHFNPSTAKRNSTFHFLFKTLQKSFFGNKKAVLVLGHFGSEYAGMRLLADRLCEMGIDAEYLHGGEVY